MRLHNQKSYLLIQTIHLLIMGFLIGKLYVLLQHTISNLIH